MHDKRRPWPTKNRFFANRHRYPEFSRGRTSDIPSTPLDRLEYSDQRHQIPSCFLSRDFRASRARARKMSERIFPRASRGTKIDERCSSSSSSFSSTMQRNNTHRMHAANYGDSSRQTRGRRSTDLSTERERERSTT